MSTSNTPSNPEQIIKVVEDTLIHSCRQAHAWNKDVPLLGLISGGSDSTALAYALAHQAKSSHIPLAFIHVNHGIRGEAADGDAAFVRTLAHVLETPLFETYIDVPALIQNEGGNLEDIARRERYAAAREALESLCTHSGLPVSSGRLVVAHTLDDRAETYFMRSIVGTGPGGLGSLHSASGDVIRPLLRCTREDLRAYLHALSQVERTMPGFGPQELWREDATNTDTHYFRSFVRHEIIPRARTRNADLLRTLERTMDVIADEDAFLSELTREAFASCVRIEGVAEGEPDATHEDGAGVFAELTPQFAQVARPIRRRVAYEILRAVLPHEARIEQRSVEAICAMVDEDAPASDAYSADETLKNPRTPHLRSGYTANIQGNLAVSSNKRGGRVEPMTSYLARRKPHKHPHKHPHMN